MSLLSDRQQENVTVANLVSELPPLLITPDVTGSNIVLSTDLVLKIVGIVALIVMIVIGNGMVMLAVRFDRTILALSQSSFLFSMALADALVGIFVIPMALLQIIYKYWPLPPIFCILYRCLDVALCTASILHLCAISMDRFWSLRIDYTKPHRARNMRIMIIVVWLLSFIICLPSALPSKFDLQYLGQYIKIAEDNSLEDDQSAYFMNRFSISPFYILDMLPETQTGNSNETSTVLFQAPAENSIVLPDRPRGNNKVLQMVSDVGDIECAQALPIEWPFLYDDNPSRQSPCKSKDNNNNDKGNINYPVVDGNFSSSDLLFSTFEDEPIGPYRCALINDIFYTFASASMSFYIPLVITIVMNVLTYWIAKRTAKAAMKRSSPAAVMLRAVIPMPLRDRSPISAQFDSKAFDETPQSNAPFLEEELDKGSSSRNLTADGNKSSSEYPTKGNSRKCSEPIIPNDLALTTSLPMQNDDPGKASKSSTDLTSPQENNTTSQEERCQPKPGAKNGTILKRFYSSVSEKMNDRGVKFATPRGSQTEIDNEPVTTTKNLIANVLQNVPLFNSNKQSVATATKKASDYDNTIHAVRIERKRRAKQRERKAALVLIIVTVTFIVCWLPFFTVFPLTRVVETGLIPNAVFEIAVWLGYVNSAVNPVIYTIFNEEFRRAFKNMFLCQWGNFRRFG